jgi:hypothetical protein
MLSFVKWKKYKKSELDKKITGLQLKYELLKDVEIKDLTKRIESFEKIVNELKSRPIIINLGTTMHNENEQTNVVGNSSDLPEQKIVFDYELTDKGKTIRTNEVPDQETVKEVCRISLYKYIFKQWDKATAIFYIGHYEPKNN